MGKPTGFLEIERRDRGYEKPEERLKNWNEFVKPLPENELKDQAARCMNCGIPFCHNGCPVNNMIPDWNHLVYSDDWKVALDTLHSTNNFPEFTGRVRSEEHTSELQSLMRISYAVFCLKKKKQKQ